MELSIVYSNYNEVIKSATVPTSDADKHFDFSIVEIPDLVDPTIITKKIKISAIDDVGLSEVNLELTRTDLSDILQLLKAMSTQLS